MKKIPCLFQFEKSLRKSGRVRIFTLEWSALLLRQDDPELNLTLELEGSSEVKDEVMRFWVCL